jgi:5-methylcytosine-specific restriction enzyme A
VTRSIYHSPAWAAVRKRVLARDGHQCQIGYQGCKGHANAVDHIVELLDGGAPFEMTNLQAACVPCNTRKMQATKKARLRRLTVQRRPWVTSPELREW